MKSGKPFLIGETAFHHEGDARFLNDLIKEIARAKMNAVKFHLLLDAESYMVADHQALSLAKKWIFTQKQWTGFIKKAAALKLDVILLCNDVGSVDFVCREHAKVRAIEIHASGLNDYFLLEKAVKFPGTVILGVGGSTLDEIQYAIEFFRCRGKDDIFLMYGFQSFPTDYNDINLSKMLKIQQLFGLPAGYADHTDPNDPNMVPVSAMAAAMGVRVLEKHITHAFGEKRIDHQAAANKEQIAQIHDLMWLYFKVAGDGDTELSDAEKAYGNTGPMKKAIVAKKNIRKGKKITLDDLWFKRTNVSSSIRQNSFLQFIGLTAACDIQKDEIVDFSKVNYTFQRASFNEFKVKKGK